MLFSEKLRQKKTVKNGKKSYLHKMMDGYNESRKTQSGYLFS